MEEKNIDELARLAWNVADSRLAIAPACAWLSNVDEARGGGGAAGSRRPLIILERFLWRTHCSILTGQPYLSTAIQSSAILLITIFFL